MQGRALSFDVTFVCEGGDKPVCVVETVGGV